MRTEELLSHAIAIEQEAAARCAELGERLRDLGSDELGELFLGLAREEAELEQDLQRRARRLRVQPLRTNEHAWLDAGAPERSARELVMRLLTPHGALAIARGGEQRALAFFERARGDADDPLAANLAAMLAEEERERLKRVERALARTPDPVIDWEELFG
jgi:rubrerythrin